MADFPALPLWTDAYLADTLHLDATESGAYLHLLMAAWRSPSCSIPDDDTRLARMARCTPAIWRRIKPTVLAFWSKNGENFEQKRLKKERVRVEAQREQKSYAGKTSALKRKDSAPTAVKPPLQQNWQQDGNENPTTISISISKSIEEERQCPTDTRQNPPRIITEDDLLDRPACLGGGTTEKTAPPLMAAVDAWNEMAERAGLDKVQRLTAARKRSLAARLRDAGGLDGWKAMIGRVEVSSFLLGRTGDGKWRVGFDFVLREQQFTKIMEGAYNDRAQSVRDGRQAAIDAAILRATGLDGGVAAAPAGPGEPGGFRAAGWKN